MEAHCALSLIMTSCRSSVGAPAAVESSASGGSHEVGGSLIHHTAGEAHDPDRRARIRVTHCAPRRLWPSLVADPGNLDENLTVWEWDIHPRGIF
jgi:hypothetical protein